MQKHTENTSGHNNSKPTLGSHVKCWNIFCVRKNKFKAALTILRWVSLIAGLEWMEWKMEWNSKQTHAVAACVTGTAQST